MGYKLFNGRRVRLMALPGYNAACAHFRLQRAPGNVFFIPKGNAAADNKRIAKPFFNHNGLVGRQVAAACNDNILKAAAEPAGNFIAHGAAAYQKNVLACQIPAM